MLVTCVGEPNGSVDKTRPSSLQVLGRAFEFVVTASQSDHTDEGEELKGKRMSEKPKQTLDSIITI